MSRHIVKPEAIDLETAGRRDYFVALEHDTIWGDHLIPLTVIVGPNAQVGKGLVVMGSNHGNEYEGPVVIRMLMREIAPEFVIGRLIFIPILNPAAFRAGTRDSSLDDGLNLNRAFVEGAGRTPSLSRITHRIVDFLRKYIWQHVHVVIDLHAGGEIARFGKCTSFHPIDDPEQSKRTEETARWFGTPLVIAYQNKTPGLLASELEQLGKITIGAELGWGSAVQADGVRFGRHGVLAAALHHGQMTGVTTRIGHHLSGTQLKAEIVDRECFTTTPISGYYEPIVECGERVKAGNVVGLVHDFERIDAAPWPAMAEVDGVVVAQAWGARVNQGQHIVVTGRIIPWING